MISIVLCQLPLICEEAGMSPGLMRQDGERGLFERKVTCTHALLCERQTCNFSQKQLCNFNLPSPLAGNELQPDDSSEPEAIERASLLSRGQNNQEVEKTQAFGPACNLWNLHRLLPDFPIKCRGENERNFPNKNGSAK